MDEKKKILIVEDELPLSEALIKKFTQEGFTVFRAKNGEEGLEIALREHPDITLLDIVMPTMNGWTMFEKLRNSGDWGKSAAVIMLTNISSDSDEQIRHISNLEPAYFITKVNWKIDDVLAKVRSRLEDS